MERVTVYAVGDRLYPHPGGHMPGQECRFLGRKHVRFELKPGERGGFEPITGKLDTHRSEFPALRDGQEIVVGALFSGADMDPSDLSRALTHGDLSLTPPASAVEVSPAPAKSEPAPLAAPAPEVTLTAPSAE